MANPSSITSLPILRHTLSEIAAFAKPLTRWDKPAITTANEQDSKTSRTAIFLIAVSAIAIGFVSLSSRKTRLLLAAGSALAGMFYKYRDNTAHILQQRDEVRNAIETFMENIRQQQGKVGNNIEKFNLAKIRSLYPDQNVISDQELSEWASYFLHTQEFENFAHTDWLWVCDFQLESCKLNTPELIWRKYCYRIYHPDNPENLMLFREVYYAFTEKKQEKIKKLQKIVSEQVKNFYSNDTWKKYTPTLEVSETQRAIYAWHFNINIWNQKIGINELEEQYKGALESFAPYFKDYSPRRYIADRDAAVLTYAEFVGKNGKAAIRHISNVLCFLKLILQQNLGLKKIKEKYEVDIVRFGDAALVERAVLKQEWSQLANLTYEQVRTRNGKEAILEVSDPEIKKQLKEKMLELTPDKLTNEEYREEVEFLSITDREIIERLHQSRAKMVFSEILKISDSKRKDRILEFFKNEKGKQQAIDEIEGVSVEKVFGDYKLLFDKGILDYKDRGFTSRLQNLSAKELSDLLVRYRDFLLNKNLLKKDKLICSISLFVFEHRQIFLTDKQLFERDEWKIFYEYINETFLRLRANTLNDIDAEEQKHSKRVEKLENTKKVSLGKIRELMEEAKNKVNEESQKYQDDIARLNKELEIKRGSYSNWGQHIEDLKLKVEQKEKELEEEKLSLDNIKKKKSDLGDVSKKLEDLREKCREKRQSLVNLQKDLKEDNRSSKAVKELARDIKTLPGVICGLDEWRKTLEKEQLHAKTQLKTLEKSNQPRPSDKLKKTSHSDFMPKFLQNLVSNTTGDSDLQQVQPLSKQVMCEKMADPQSCEDNGLRKHTECPEGFLCAEQGVGQSQILRQFPHTVSEQTPETTSDELPNDANQADIEQLKSQIKKIQDDIDNAIKKKEECKRQFTEKSQAIEIAINDVSQHPRYVSLVKKIEEIKKECTTLEEKQPEFDNICKELQACQNKVELLASEIEGHSTIKSTYEGKKSKIEEEVCLLESQLKAAQIHLDQVNKDGNSVKTQFSNTLEATEKLHDAEIDIENKNFPGICKKLTKQAEERLRDVYNILYY